jgi:hypothetical protein
MHRHLRTLLFAVLLPGPLPAQTLAQGVNAVGEGTVRLSFPARPGTCGDGTNGMTVRQVSDEWQPDCNPRLVRVALGLSERRIQSVRTYVGGQWLPKARATDLGIVRPHEAAAYFIGLARRDAETGLGGDALLPAVLADSVTIWPSLLGIARSPRLSAETRGQAVFWLSQAASAAAGQALDSIAADDRGEREVRPK